MDYIKVNYIFMINIIDVYYQMKIKAILMQKHIQYKIIKELKVLLILAIK